MAHSRKKHLTVLQIIGLAAAITATITGVTYAALQSQLAIIQGSSIQTATAALQVSGDGTNFSNSIQGFNFGNIVPGGNSVPTNGYPVYVKNVGSTPLQLKMNVKDTLLNPDMVDLSKVRVSITPNGGTTQITTLQELMTTGVPINQAQHLIASQVFSITLRVSMDADAVNGSSASLSNVDFTFSAVATN